MTAIVKQVPLFGARAHLPLQPQSARDAKAVVQAAVRFSHETSVTVAAGLADEQREWDRQERNCYAAYVGALARAYGFGEVVATTAAALVRRGAKGAAYYVSTTRIEVEIIAGVSAIFRNEGGA